MKIKENIINRLRDINSENKRKKFLIYFFTSAALLSLLAFGIKGFSDGRITYSIIISVFFIIAFANLIILKFFNKIKLSAHIMLFLMFMLELTLFSSLGAGISGLFWYYVFPPLAITLLDNKKGTIYSFLLIAVTFTILVVKPDFLTNTYSNEIIFRFIFTYSVVGILINIFEYARNTADKAYRSNLSETKGKNDELISAEEELRQNNEELLSLNDNIQSQKDIIENKNNELHKYFTAIEQNAVSIVFTDIKGNIEYTNPQFSKLTGYTKEEALGKNLSFLKSGKTPKNRIKELWDTILNGKTWNGEFINQKKDGTEFYEHA
ncbi:MAG: PAS domain S-box protein, partial [Bacteroidota bacterium]|nr:PAS domain S-box protein [Bacteroidota bacterium]